MMKKKQAPKAQTKDAKSKQIILAVIGAVLITAVVLYNLWFWIVAPNNQRQFNQNLTENIEQHKNNVQNYLLRLQQPLQNIADNVPNDIMGSYKVESWLADYQKSYQTNMPHLKTLTLFSLREIEYLLALSPDRVEANNVRFIIIDMINRLQKGSPLFIEAARGSHTSNWELNGLLPIYDDRNNLLGVLHATFSLQGIEQLFHTTDLSLGHISLTQSIENEQDLLFFSVGEGSSGFINKTQRVANSHWRIAYQPSLLQYEAAQRIPWWFFVIAVTMPLLFMIVAIYSLYQAEANQFVSLRKSSLRSAHKKVDDSDEIKIDTDKNSIPTLTAQEDIVCNIPHSIFRAYDIRGLAHEQLSHDLVFAIGQAVATEVLAAGDTAMIVGYDARTHSVGIFGVYDRKELVVRGVMLLVSV